MEEKIINVITDFTAEQIVDNTADSVRIEEIIKVPVEGKYQTVDGKEIEGTDLIEVRKTSITFGELKEKLDGLNSEIQIVSSRLAGLGAERDSVQAKIDEYQPKVDEAMTAKVQEGEQLKAEVI